MTHLSWDEFGARVLERRNSRDPGHAAGLRPRECKALADKLLGRIKMFRFRRLALAALIPAAALSFGLSATLAQTPRQALQCRLHRPLQPRPPPPPVPHRARPLRPRLPPRRRLPCRRPIP